MNLKKFVKKLPRFAVLTVSPGTNEFEGDVIVRFRTGKSEKSSTEVWSKIIPENQYKKLAFKIPEVPGFMFRVLSGKIYIREEIV